MNWSNKSWELLEEKLLYRVLVVEASLRLVKYDEEHSERLEFGCCTGRTIRRQIDNELKVEFLFGGHFGGNIGWSFRRVRSESGRSRSAVERMWPLWNGGAVGISNESHYDAWMQMEAVVGKLRRRCASRVGEPSDARRRLCECWIP
ncbi:hypothetical protein A2U01_0020274 [Trifolium medium]|uniref:Uncharacterized protein n=1 Tax=Trifolium medium TaxID=97028 RepID=A0A392NHK0_9FABA|nr:hypothetical protein [Trifolium medium]